MKPLNVILAAAALLTAGAPQAGAEVRISADFFHDALDPYGDWRQVGDYGYGWSPRDVGRDWRPYSEGHWVYTDAGWTFNSDEPYSWAVHHYGRWIRTEGAGWVWIPGTEWGPAWVSWRRSPEYIGWAPLPPEAHYRAGQGFGVRVDLDFDIGPSNYGFVRWNDFGSRRLGSVTRDHRENLTIYRETTNITKITTINNVVYNQGPDYDEMSRRSDQPIRRLRLDRRERLDGEPGAWGADQLKSKEDGDVLRVAALPFEPRTKAAPRKVGAKLDRVEVNHGWKDIGSPEEVAKVRNKLREEADADESSPKAAAKETKAKAKSSSDQVEMPTDGRGEKAKSSQESGGEVISGTGTTKKSDDKVDNGPKSEPTKQRQVTDQDDQSGKAANREKSDKADEGERSKKTESSRAPDKTGESVKPVNREKSDKAHKADEGAQLRKTEKDQATDSGDKEEKRERAKSSAKPPVPEGNSEKAKQEKSASRESQPKVSAEGGKGKDQGQSSKKSQPKGVEPGTSDSDEEKEKEEKDKKAK